MKFKHILSTFRPDLVSENEKKEMDLEDFDSPNGWLWKEIDLLINMGFDKISTSRLSLQYEDDKKASTIEVYKNEDGYNLQINDRKYVFKTFNTMLDKIEEFGQIEL